MPTQTRVVVRAVIQKNQKIILCRAKGVDSYFFPGGGIEFQERATDALRREMKEELGAELIDVTFIGVVENQFVENGIANHEINLVFSVTIDDVPIASHEPHIAFS